MGSTKIPGDTAFMSSFSLKDCSAFRMEAEEPFSEKASENNKKPSGLDLIAFSIFFSILCSVFWVVVISQI